MIEVAAHLKFMNVGIRSVTLVIRFALIFMLAAFLPPAQVGLYGLIVVTVSYAIYFAGFDFYTFSTRDLLRRDRSEWARFLFSEGLLFLLLYALLLPLTLSLFVLQLLPWWTAGWILVLFVSEHLSQEISRLAVAMGRPLVASIMVFVRQGLWALVFMVLLFLGELQHALETLLGLWAVGSVLSVMFGSMLFKSVEWGRHSFVFDVDWVLRGLKISLPLLVATLALRAIMTADRYAFEAINGADLLGAYSLFMGMAGAVLTFIEAGIFSFLYPKLITCHAKGELVEFASIQRSLSRQTFFWLMILIGFGAFLGPLVFSLLPQPIYYENWPIFIGLLISIGIYVLGLIPHYSLYAVSSDKPIIWSHIAGLLIFLIAVYALADVIPKWSVVFALVFAFSTIGIVKQVYYSKVFNQMKKTKITSM